MIELALTVASFLFLAIVALTVVSIFIWLCAEVEGFASAVVCIAIACAIGFFLLAEQ